MKIKILEIKENPFRKELGAYNEEQIGKIFESFKMSDYGKDMRFEVRKNANHYELVYGHHRFLAFKRYYGDDLEIEVIKRNYNDLQMLRELLRENLIKSNDWHFKMLSLALINDCDGVFSNFNDFKIDLIVQEAANSTTNSIVGKLTYLLDGKVVLYKKSGVKRK